MAIEVTQAKSGGGMIIRDTLSRKEVFVDRHELRATANRLGEGADRVDLENRAGYLNRPSRNVKRVR